MSRRGLVRILTLIAMSGGGMGMHNFNFNSSGFGNSPKYSAKDIKKVCNLKYAKSRGYHVTSAYQKNRSYST
jgi:hypothetical protein